MSSEGTTTRSRRRAVRLTPEAAGLLQKSVYEAWVRAGGKGRLTREAKAEMLGLSVSTSERVFACGGVDRSTVTLAFAKVGLPWHERYLEAGSVAQPTTGEQVKTQNTALTSPGPTRRLTDIRPMMLVGTFVVLAALGAPILMSPRAEASGPRLASASTAALLKGSSAYHSGQYGLAQSQVSEALTLASQYRDTGRMSSALRVEGDIAAARGDYDTALIKYGTALTLKQLLKDEVSYPALYEALGDLRTRMGDIDKAEADLTNSYRLYSRFGDHVGVAMAARNLGTVWYLRKDWKRADEWFARALKSLAGQDKPELLTDITARRAVVTAQRGDIAAAKEELTKVLAFWEGKKHLRWQAVTLQQLGTVAGIEGDKEAARSDFIRSQELFVQAGDRAGSAASAKLAKQVR